MKFRELTADEIECRIQSVGKMGVQLLLYKNARCDMQILDESVGTFGWQREHYECKGNLFCRVGIYNDLTKEWIWKADCGAESNVEKEKGESSDSFKRACTNFGIGRSLYTSPKIMIWTTAKDGTPNAVVKDGKCYDKFVVEKIAYADGKITGLAIKNASLDGKRVFVWKAE